jgi:undecaprenyl diphosphate synthase
MAAKVVQNRTDNPTHIAMIMDGNGRWAKKRLLPRIAGHRQGTKTVERVLKACLERAIQCLTLYAFSTENWKRPQAEVKGLMTLLKTFLQEHKERFLSEGIQLRIVGDLTPLPEDLQSELNDLCVRTSAYDKLIVAIALNYGARAEMTQAVRKIAAKCLNQECQIEDIKEQMIDDNLYTSGLPELDLLIRTGGEMRLSNFLLWQASYAELAFTETLWPDFDEAELDNILTDYRKRKRRFGRVDDA